MKRQRGRGRKPGGGHHHNQHHHPNRALESSGPEVKVRGPASHIYERYLQLARDAASSGDRVLSENYLQHADHYFRLVRAMQPAMPPPQADRFNGDSDFEGDEEGGSDGEGGEGEVSAEGDQPDVDFPQGGQPQQFDRGGEGDFRRGRGRGRRNRFRPEGEREGGEDREQRGEGERGGDRPERSEQRAERGDRPERNDRPERAERPERRERAPRDRDGDSSGPEGFSNGPKPAFLRSGD